MTATASTYPFRLPLSIKTEAEKLAAAQSTTLDQLVATTAADRVAASRNATYFSERSGKADWEAFDRLISRQGGEPPCPGDALPAS